MEYFWIIVGSFLLINFVVFLFSIKNAKPVDEDEILSGNYRYYVSNPVFGTNAKIYRFIKYSWQNTPYADKKLKINADGLRLSPLQ